MGSAYLSRLKGKIFHIKEGNIFKVDPKTNLFSPLKVKKLKENFLSHLSVGHHSQLAASYESNYK